MDDRRCKNIMIGYGRVNQWSIYTLKKNKTHFLTSIWFDKSFGYYYPNHKLTKKDGNNDTKMDDVGNDSDDDGFIKLRARKQVVKMMLQEIFLSFSYNKSLLPLTMKRKKNNNSFLKTDTKIIILH